MRLTDLACRVVIHLDHIGRQHVLFARNGRFLQLEILGEPVRDRIRLLTDALSPNHWTRTGLRAIKRLADLERHGDLRCALYPADPRSARLSMVLAALDGRLAGASYRQIAMLLYGEDVVSREWRDARRLLLYRIIRLVERGKALMNGGYRKLLR